MKKLEVRNFGPITEASISLGDLNVFVGPQATGKSIFLQLFKLLLDARPIQNELKHFGNNWDGDRHNFYDLYFGEGMSSLEGPDTVLLKDGKPVDFVSLMNRRKPAQDRAFLIPAQRVMALREGLTRPFTDYRSGDPFALREFSERLHNLIQAEFAGKGSEVFPVPNRLKKEYRDKISESIFGKFNLNSDPQRLEKRLVLRSGPKALPLPYLVWSAGQREFVPLLLGLYWLMPPAKVSRRGELEWVIIEELEMGLHPQAISTVLLLVMELIHRGYKVCLSTHSPHVLDLVWALRIMREQKGTTTDFLKLFKLPSNDPMKAVAESAIAASSSVHFFSRSGEVHDISALDPGADNPIEADWGGLSEFSGNVNDIVANIVNRSLGDE